MSEHMEGPICPPAMVEREPSRDEKGNVVVYLRYYHDDTIFSLALAKENCEAEKLMQVKVGDLVFLPRSAELIGSIEHSHPLKRLWRCLFW